jgi:hypothetical protein
MCAIIAPHNLEWYPLFGDYPGYHLGHLAYSQPHARTETEAVRLRQRVAALELRLGG